MDLKVTHWIIKSKRDGTCHETGVDIKVGETVLYLPGIKGIVNARIFCEDSKAFKEAEANPARTGWKI